MSAALRAELFKQRSVPTTFGLLAAMMSLVVFAVLLHGLGVGSATIESSTDQITLLFGWGEVLAALFAALLGAISITSEIRHGTIRPTFLVTPWRRRVVAAKVWASMLVGAGFGLAAGSLAAAVGSAALHARGVEVEVGPADYALVIAGSAVAAALWAAIGVGVGAAVRHQVPALVGICAWILFIENLLVGDVAGVGAVGRLLPGAAGKAISGQDPSALLPPGVGLALLAFYAIAAGATACVAIARRDF